MTALPTSPTRVAGPPSVARLARLGCGLAINVGGAVLLVSEFFRLATEAI